MRTIRTLGLSVCAALLLTAPPASAAEVVTESTGIHCSAITENDAPATPEVAGGCPIKGLSNPDFEIGGAFGVMVLCDIELEGKMNEAGAINGVWSNSNSCEVGQAVPCTGASDSHFATSNMSGSSPDWSVTTNFCAVAFGLANRCSGVAGTWHENGWHIYTLEFVHTRKCANGVNSIQGAFALFADAAHPDIEVR